MTGLAAVTGAAVLVLPLCPMGRICPLSFMTWFPTFLSAVNFLVFVQPLSDLQCPQKAGAGQVAGTGAPANCALCHTKGLGSQFTSIR